MRIFGRWRGILIGSFRSKDPHGCDSESDIRKALLLLGSLIASLVVGGLAAAIGFETLPCQWFGTAFEGACAYGVLYTSIAIGLAVAALAFSYLCYRVLGRGGQSR
jgi:hypothetical protein